MVHAGVLQLEGRLSVEGNPFPAFSRAVTEFLLDTFSPQRHLLRRIEEHEQRRQYAQAAECAVELGDYSRAFQFYDALIKRGDVRDGSYRAAELAESRGDYQRAIAYRLLGLDFIMAAHDAASLGRYDLRDRYWGLACHPLPETD